MTLVKFPISSYFAQITSIEKIEKSSKIPILAASRRRKLCIFLSLVQVNAMLSINLLWIVDSACLALSKALI